VSRTRRLIYGLIVTAAVLLAAELGLRASGVMDQDRLISPLLFQQLDSGEGALPIDDGWVRWVDGTTYQQAAPGLRVITVGGSATAGDGVTPFSSFSSQLQRRLVHADTGGPVEVINMGRGGMGSRQVVAILRQGLEAFEPDLAVVYAGNNEFHELRALKHASPAYGANLERTRRRLHALHSYRALQQLLGRADPIPFERVGPGLPAVQDLPTTVDAQDRALAVELYSENLTRMAEAARAAGVPLLLATVADNRADFVDTPPGVALSADQEQLAAQLEALARSGDRDALQAELGRVEPQLRDERAWFRAGRALLQAGLRDDARRLFDQAELVQLRPNRSNRELRAALRTVALAEETSLCDVAEQLDRVSMFGTAGGDLFYDACHPNPAGHARIAALIASCAQRDGLLPAIDAQRRLPIDPWRLDHHQLRLDQLPATPPADPAQAAAQAGHEAFARGAPDQAWAHYQRAVELGGPPEILGLNRALVRWHQGRRDDAQAILQQLPDADPEISNWKALLTR